MLCLFVLYKNMESIDQYYKRIESKQMSNNFNFTSI